MMIILLVIGIILSLLFSFLLYSPFIITIENTNNLKNLLGDKLITQIILLILMILTWLLIMNNGHSNFESLIIGILSLLLWIIAFIDYFSYKIPLIYLIMSFILGIIYLVFINSISYVLTSILIAILFSIVITLLSYIFKKTLMGLGDLLLIIVLSFFLNWTSLLLVIGLASLLGIIWYELLKIFFNRKEKIFPFGPYLVISFIVVYLYHECILSMYIDLLRGIL